VTEVPSPMSRPRRKRVALRVLILKESRIHVTDVVSRDAQVTGV